MHRLAVILHARRTASAALNVLTGALDAAYDGDPPCDVRFVCGPAELAAALDGAATDGRRCLVAWSFYSPEVPAVAEELAAARAVSPPGALHVAGGVHATAEPAATLALGFDLVVIGEGEEPFVSLVAALADGDGDGLDHVPGLARLDGAGALRRNSPAPRHPLDHFPPFAAGRGRFNAIEITRGCVYGCTFCQTPYMFKARFRHRSVDDVGHWIRVLRSTGRRDVRFLTPTCLSYGSGDESVNLPAVEALLAAARDAAGPDGRVYFGTFPSELRPEHATPDALELIRRYCDNDNVVIGGQSGSDAVLARTNRGHDVAAVLDAVRACVDVGLVPNVDLLFGLPSETGDDARATRELAVELRGMGARVHSHTFMPLPGTPLRDAPAGRVDETTRAELDRLASAGGAYGAWRRQEELADALVAIRPPRRR